MTDLDKALVSRERHYKDRELDYSWFFMLFDIELIDDEFLLNFFLLFNFLE